jgi:membrane fusion protein (multidrug efflux system)
MNQMMKKQNNLIVVCLLILTSCGGNEEGLEIGSATMKPNAVEVFSVEVEDISKRIEVPGTIIPAEEVQIFSEINGRVQKINFQEGRRVAKGALLLQVDTDILRAQKILLKVQYDLAIKDESRKKGLLAAKGISLEDYEKSASAMESIQAEMGLLDVQISKGAIRAPFSGRIGLRKISEGAFISPTSIITTLVKDDPLKIEFSIPGMHASSVELGQTIRLQLEKQEKIYTAKVFAFEPFINVETRMLTIRAELKNDGNLIPGTFVAIEYDLGVEKDAMMVPAESIISILNGQKVMVVRNGIATDVPVQIGIRTSNRVQIMGDIHKGDKVMISGLLAVRDGMPVTIKSLK